MVTQAHALLDKTGLWLSMRNLGGATLRQKFRRSQLRIRLCSLYRSILLRRPNSEILEGLSPNCNSEVSQVGFAQSNEIRDKKTKTIARSVLVVIYPVIYPVIYSLLYSRFSHREKYDPPELGSRGFKDHLIQINSDMRDGVCPLLDGSEIIMIKPAGVPIVIVDR